MANLGDTNVCGTLNVFNANVCGNWGVCGYVTATTPMVGDDSTKVATTEFVNDEIINYRPYSTVDPLMNGVVSQGSSPNISREDHVHPADTTRVSGYDPARTYVLNEPTFYNGVPYRSKQNGNTGHNPEAEEAWWEVTGGGSTTVKRISAINVGVVNKLIALNSSGQLVLADRKIETTAKSIGFNKDILSVGVEGKILGNGSIINTFSGLTPGKSLYLAYNGNYTQDEEEIEAGEFRQHVGIALSATEVLVFVQEPVQMLIGGTTTKDGVGIEAFWSSEGAAPSGWLKEDGSAVSRTIYADLFSFIGIEYGAGDGSTTFNLPNVVGGIIRAIPWNVLIQTNPVNNNIYGNIDGGLSNSLYGADQVIDGGSSI